MRETGKLTAAKVAKLSRPGRYGDGAGLWLQVTQSGTKSWLLRFNFAGRARQMGLGPLSTVTLAEARARARAGRTALLDGDDPIELRREKRASVKAETAKRITFREAAEKYIAAHKAGWRNKVHAGQWPATLETYAYPVIGSLSVAAIETAHVVRILESIWTDKTETAGRVRGRIEAVLDWAKARRYREGENPARWKGHLQNLLPEKTRVHTVRHQPALAFTALPDFMKELRSLNSQSARALEFTILTAVRTGATIGALWSEIDLVSQIWTIPSARAGTKLRQDMHRVPLSQRAIEILQSLPREKGNDHVFIGAKKGQGLSNMAMLETLRGLRKDSTVHGFRSAFKDWSSESTNYADIVSEMALAHVVRDKVQAAYRRGELLEKRTRLMEAWARFCASSDEDDDKVVRIRRRNADRG